MLIQFIPKEDIPLNYRLGEFTLLQDTEYVLNEVWAKDMKGESYPLNFSPYSIDNNCNGKSILFIRSLGLGDILFLSPLINSIKIKYPSCKIGFATIKEHHSLLDIIPGIDTCVNYPILKSEFDGYDYHIYVGSLIESEIENVKQNVYEVYHNAIDNKNVTEEDFRPIVDKSITKQIEIIPNRIGIHPFAGDPIRRINLHQCSLLAKILLNVGYEVFIFSDIHEKSELSHMFDSNVKWAIDYGSDIKITAKLLKSCYKVVTTDSMIVHLCQALDVPTIAIYGPFDPDSRVKYYKNIRIIDMNPDCRCSTHHLGKCPKGYYSISPCMLLDPDMIVDMIKNDNVYATPFEYDKVNVIRFNHKGHKNDQD